MNRYPDIGNHGLIGDLQTAALVSTDGTIDWMCCPRFDSPSIFASLLDYDRGGHFRVAPDRDDYVSRQLYFPDTAILITRFMTPDGVGEVVDFMPVIENEATDRHRLVRLLRVVRGTMRFRMDIQPRFDYGRKPHELHLSEEGALFVSDDLTLTLHRADIPGRSLHEQGTSLDRDGDGLRITKSMREGGVAGVVMESAGGLPRSVHPQELLELFNDTARFWRGWLNRSTYNGRWKEQVTRSAMTLKLMTYAPSGGLIAAPTAALPEQVGGERNWDYRYTWIRDASFSVHALLGLGYRGGRRLRRLAQRSDRRASGRGLRAAEDHVPGRRLFELRGGGSRPFRGLPWVPSGSDRQRRGRSTAAGYLRRGDGFHLSR
jgi:GH15 family glucan-1,4-alpha-glucosidase